MARRPAIISRSSADVLAGGVVRGARHRIGHRASHDPALRYLLAWAGANWLMFEVVPTKLPHYILPAYPALAFLGALWAMRAKDESEPWWMRTLRYAAALQFALGVAAFALVPIIAPDKFGDGTTWWLIAGASAGAALGIAATVLVLQRMTVPAAVCAVAAAAISSIRC